ncbi:putative reverse transcriptase domain-containing protein [Tanacetum coccineum]
MRQRRWLDLLKDYDCEIRYHHGKANVVADALSQKEREKNWKSERSASYIPHLEDDSRGIKTRQGRIYIPFRSNVKELLFEEAHKSKYSIHPGATKMYLDLKKNYLWQGMKRDCVKCVEKCLTCLKVKAKHQKLYGKIQPLEIPVWKWEKITMDFVTKLPRTTKKHDAIWVIVDRLTKSAHFIPIRENMPIHKLAKIYVNEIIARHGVPVSIIFDRDGLASRELASTDMVLATTEIIETIRERLKEAQDSWKNYVDNRRRLIKFNVGYFVMLKVSPWKVIIEQRVKVNQKSRILELKRRNYEEYYFDIPYVVSIKEDTAYACPELHSASTKERSIHRIHKKVIRRIQVQVMEYSGI